MEDIKFFKPKEGWEEAKLLRILEPKEEHVYQIHHWGLNAPSQLMYCCEVSCPICQVISERKTRWIKFMILLQSIFDAFKKFFKREGGTKNVYL